MFIGIAVLAALVCLGAVSHHHTDQPWKEIVSDFEFPEGPALSADGKYVYVVNVQSNKIARVTLRNHHVEHDWVVLPEKGRGNGSTIGPDGELYIADVGRKCIEKIDTKTRLVTTVIDKTPEGKALRGPNDLIFDSKGDLYFTDPDGTWNEPTGQVYHVEMKTGKINLIADGMQFPNGLVLSKDELTLYVAESPLNRITAIDVTPNGIVPPGRKSVFAELGERAVPDGMRFDKNGCLFVANNGRAEIAKVSSDGKIIGSLKLREKASPTNLCFSHDGKSIFITDAQHGALVEAKISH